MPVTLTTESPAATAAPSTADPTSPPIEGGVDALVTLATIPVAHVQAAGYLRSNFGADWTESPAGCSTRVAVLVRDSSTPVVQSGCKVETGTWLSPYDAVTVTDPAGVQIDHVVPLHEVWESGAYAWSAQRRLSYANDMTDPRTLRAATSASNLQKGDRDPTNWLPASEADMCRYLSDWVSIKARWGLTMDESEAGRIRNLFRADCPGLQIAPSIPPDIPLIPTTTVTTTPAVAPTSAAEAPSGDVYYQNCTAVRAAGEAPLHRGDPGYRSGLDRDGDGVACE